MKGIYVQNDFVDGIVNNLDAYNYDMLFYAALETPYFKKVFNELWIRCAKSGELDRFVNDLLNNECYYEYMAEVLDTHDDFMISFISLTSNEEMIDEVIGDDIDKKIDGLISGDTPDINNRLLGLTILATQVIDEKTINRIKENVSDIIRKQYSDTSYKREMNRLLDAYDNIIDQTKGQYVKQYSYKNK